MFEILKSNASTGSMDQSVWIDTDINETLAAAVEKFGQQTAIAANHYAKNARSDGHEKDYQFWLAIYLRVTYAEFGENPDFNPSESCLGTVPFEDLQAFQKKILGKTLQ